MAAAAICGKEAACSWDEEIDELFARGPRLSLEARRAVCSALDSIMTEGVLDARQTHRADRLRLELSGRLPQLAHAA